ncbi:dienelactone hydrolase family protein [Rhodococcus fascians]|nr:dienelactone hydrolase family protein [Rhodococcus fascians]MBY4115212.1 dienelactone hydrolase family protein [Rhodococcus fascians]
MAKPKKLASALSKRGPHKVLRGNLALAGQPGVVYTPAEGFGLPGVAFAHGWMLRPGSYTDTLKHLASWGFVVAAPDTERGLVPSHRGLATDLGTVLDIMTGVRLGSGNISVHPENLATVGHAMGAGTAVLAASRRPDVKAVAALFPAPTAPSSEDAAAGLDMPGLVVGDSSNTDSLNDNSLALARAWHGPSVLRRIDGSTADGFVEGRRMLRALGVNSSDRKTQQRTRAVLTAFLLYHLTGDSDYEELAGTNGDIAGTRAVDPHAPLTEQPKPKATASIKALLGRG